MFVGIIFFCIFSGWSQSASFFNDKLCILCAVYLYKYRRWICCEWVFDWAQQWNVDSVSNASGKSAVLREKRKEFRPKHQARHVIFQIPIGFSIAINFVYFSFSLFFVSIMAIAVISTLIDLIFSSPSNLQFILTIQVANVHKSKT